MATASITRATAAAARTRQQPSSQFRAAHVRDPRGCQLRPAAAIHRATCPPCGHGPCRPYCRWRPRARPIAAAARDSERQGERRPRRQRRPYSATAHAAKSPGHHRTHHCSCTMSGPRSRIARACAAPARPAGFRADERRVDRDAPRVGGREQRTAERTAARRLRRTRTGHPGARPRRRRGIRREAGSRRRRRSPRRGRDWEVRRSPGDCPPCGPPVELVRSRDKRRGTRPALEDRGSEPPVPFQCQVPAC